MGKITYKDVDELPDLTKEPIHQVNPVTKKVTTYKSVDELPDLKKKAKTDSNVTAKPSGNGLSNTQTPKPLVYTQEQPTLKSFPTIQNVINDLSEKTKKTKERKYGVQGNPVTDNLAEGYIIAPIVQDKNIRYKEQPPIKKKKEVIDDVSGIALLDNGKFVFKDSLLEKKLREKPVDIPAQALSLPEQAIREKQIEEAPIRAEKKKKDTEMAVNNTALKVLKSKGITATEGSAQFNEEKQKIQKALDNGEVSLSYEKSSDNPVLRRTTGFWETAKNKWNESMQSNEDADRFMNNMTTKERVDYVNSLQKSKEEEDKLNFPYSGTRPTDLGSVGGFLGENAPFLIKAAEAGALGTIAVAAAPETMGASLEGLPVAAAFIATAPEMINQGAMNETIRRYQMLKKEHPDFPDEVLMKQAEEGKWSGGLAGLATNALMMGTGILETPILNEGKSVVGNFLKRTTKSALTMGGTTAAVEAAKDIEGIAEGYKVTPQDVLENSINTFVHGATVGALLHMMIGEAPKAVKSAIKYGITKSVPISEVKADLEIKEQNGIIPQGTTEKIVTDLEGYKSALDKTQSGLSEEAKSTVAGLIQKKENLIKEQSLKDDSAKDIYKEKIDAINAQIQEINSTGKVVEVDELIGDKFKSPEYKGEPERISKPIELSVEPSQEQQLKDIQNGDTVTFTYKTESEVPDVFKDKISSKGEVNGEPVIRVTVAKSLADYELAKQKPSTVSGSALKDVGDAELGIQQGYAKKAMTDFINSPDMGYSFSEEGGKTTVGLSEAQVRNANGLKGGDRIQPHEHTNIELTKDEKKKLNKIESDKQLGDIDGLEYAKQKRDLVKKIFERASNELSAEYKKAPPQYTEAATPAKKESGGVSGSALKDVEGKKADIERRRPTSYIRDSKDKKSPLETFRNEAKREWDGVSVITGDRMKNLYVGIQLFVEAYPEHKDLLDKFIKKENGTIGITNNNLSFVLNTLKKQGVTTESEFGVKINAKYDAELKALEQPTPTTQSEIEAKKADIERRRQEELNKVNQKIEKLKQKEDRRVKTEKYRTLDINDNPVEVEITTNADGTRVLKARQINEDGSVEPMAYVTERINNKAQASLTNEKLIEGSIGNEGNTLKRTNIDENHDQTYIDKINAKYDAELATLEETSGVSGSALKDVVPVFHHTKVDVKDFDFGNFQRGKNQVSQFGDGLAVSTDTTPFLQKRYGNPIKGEVKDSDFVVIDTNKTEKEIYEELKSKGYKFNKPDGGSYIGNDPAKEYDGTEKANEQPAIISLFNDFQKSNPEVKGVKIVNHIIANEKVSPFYVIYDNKSFYGEGSLKATTQYTEAATPKEQIQNEKENIQEPIQEGDEGVTGINEPITPKETEPTKADVGEVTPPPSEPKEVMGEGEGKEWVSVRKEKLKEIEGAKEHFEKRTKKKWTEIYQSALENVQKLYPKKSLYEAMKSRVDYMASLIEKKELFNPTSEDIAVFNVFRDETQKRIKSVEGIDSDNPIIRQAALAELEGLKNDLLNVARVTNPNGEAGRAFGMLQSEISTDPENGLKIRRMDLMKSKGGEPLTVEEEAWVKDHWEKEKELINKEHEIKMESMQQDFNDKIAELQKQYEEKLKQVGKNTPANKAIKTKTLSQKGKDIADQIRKLKKPKGGTNIDFTLGTWDLAVEGIAQLVEKGSTVSEAIDKLVKDGKIGFKLQKDRDSFEDHLSDWLRNKKDKIEELDKISAFAKENGITDITKEMVDKNLIRDYVNSHVGEVDKSEILKTSFEDLKKVLPNITKERFIEAYLKEGEFKNQTKKQLEGGIKEQENELKKIAKKELTADQQQKIKLEKEKQNAIIKKKEFQKKLDEGIFEEESEPIKLKKKDAELIRLEKQKSIIEEQYRKKQKQIEEKNKHWLERAADFARGSYVAALIGSPLTLAKVAYASVMRPMSEAVRKATFGKVFNAFFPNISQAAKRGGESSSIRSIAKGYEAYFGQMGEKRINAKYEIAEKQYKEASELYEKYKKSANPDAKKLEQLKNNMNDKLIKTMGSFIYKFIGGSSIKDALQALVHRSNEIEKQFGHVEGEGIEGKNAITQSDSGVGIAKKIGKQIGEGTKNLFTGYEKDSNKAIQAVSKATDKLSYILGFIGRSHSAAKTFSGRFSFAAGFMARLEGAIAAGEDISQGNKILEIAHESYLDWERGKYQQSNAVSDLWNKWMNSLTERETGDRLKLAKAAQTLAKTEVAITRVPVNILHEGIVEYTFGAFKAAYMAAKEVGKIKGDIKQEGIMPHEAEFKEELKKRVSQMDEKQAATIVRCFTKGGLGLGLYAIALISGAIKFGIFPHLGQKKHKDEEELAPNELNPGQIMVGKNKLGETASTLIEHTNALYPTFMGLGLAQAYKDDIDKGMTTPKAAADAIYTHLKIVEGSIPQTKLLTVTGVQKSIEQIAKKRANQMGLIEKNEYEITKDKFSDVKNYKDNGRQVTGDEYRNYIKQKEKITKEQFELLKDGKLPENIFVKDGEQMTKKLTDIKDEEVKKDMISSFKARISRELKKSLFGEKEKTQQEKDDERDEKLAKKQWYIDNNQDVPIELEEQIVEIPK